MIGDSLMFWIGRWKCRGTLLLASLVFSYALHGKDPGRNRYLYRNIFPPTKCSRALARNPTKDRSRDERLRSFANHLIRAHHRYVKSYVRLGHSAANRVQLDWLEQLPNSGLSKSHQWLLLNTLANRFVALTGSKASASSEPEKVVRIFAEAFDVLFRSPVRDWLPEKLRVLLGEALVVRLTRDPTLVDAESVAQTIFSFFERSATEQYTQEQVPLLQAAALKKLGEGISLPEGLLERATENVGTQRFLVSQIGLILFAVKTLPPEGAFYPGSGNRDAWALPLFTLLEAFLRAEIWDEAHLNPIFERILSVSQRYGSHLGEAF